MSEERRFSGGASAGGKTARTDSTLDKEVTVVLSVPAREIDTIESISLGFRQHMLDMKDRNGNGLDMGTGAGWGTDAIILNFKDEGVDKQLLVRGSDIAIAWVNTFDPETAGKMREAQEAFRHG